MTALTRTLRRVIGRDRASAPAAPLAVPPSTFDEVPGIEIADNDPLLAYLQGAAGAIDLDALELSSPAVDELRRSGVKLVVPLVTQGELIGTLNLGPRLSEQEYSRDDRRLLENLAGQAAPALRVAQLVRQQEAEARERQRMEQELLVAQLIQQHFLPTELPSPRAGASRRTTARRARSAATSTTWSNARMGGSPSPSAT
jgi:hypothetical protein